MDIAITILSILHVFVALLLIMIVMWQKPRQEGLGTSFGGGMSEQMFGAQATNILQKGTVWLAIIFFANTIIIAVLMVQQTKAKRASNLLATPAPAAATAPAVPGLPVPGTPATSPGAPVEPTAPTPPSTPETPAAPAAETPAAPAMETPAAPAPETPVAPPPAVTPATEAPATPEAPAPAESPAAETPAPSGQQP